MSQFVGQNVDGTYGNNVDWTKSWNGGINPNGMYTKGLLNETSTPVVCKDGSKKMQPSSPNARYMDVCRDNGGVDNQKTNDNAIAQPKATTGGINPNGMYNTQGSNAKEPIFYILVTAGVLVAGYFAYKKFKK